MLCDAVCPQSVLGFRHLALASLSQCFVRAGSRQGPRLHWVIIAQARFHLEQLLSLLFLCAKEAGICPTEMSHFLDELLLIDDLDPSGSGYMLLHNQLP